MPTREPETRMGAYKTFHFVACNSCGQLTRNEVCWPVVTASTLHKMKFCPLCGTPFEYDKLDTGGNGTGFYLVARAVLGRLPSNDEIEMIQAAYDAWNANTYPEFKMFLRALVRGEVTV